MPAIYGDIDLSYAAVAELIGDIEHEPSARSDARRSELLEQVV